MISSWLHHLLPDSCSEAQMGAIPFLVGVRERLSSTDLMLQAFFPHYPSLSSAPASVPPGVCADVDDRQPGIVAARHRGERQPSTADAGSSSSSSRPLNNAFRASIVTPNATTEPLRYSRRLHLMRGWSHGKTKQVLGRGPGTGRSDGLGPPGPVRLAVGGHLFNR